MDNLNSEISQSHPPLLFGQRMRTVVIIAFLIGLLFAGILLIFLSKSPQQTPYQQNITRVLPSPSPTTAASPAASDAVVANWKTYKAQEENPFSTDDWYTHSYGQKARILYSFRYPSEWTSEYSVFYDATGNKISELSPGIVILKPGQKCLDKNVDYENSQGRIEFVSQQNVNITGYNGALRISKGFTEPGLDRNGKSVMGTLNYDYTYCLSEGNKAFVITFYDQELNSKKRKLFDQILSTFRFD